MAQIGANSRNAWTVTEGVVDLTRDRRPPRRVQLPARPQPVVLDLARTACVVIDMQNDFCAPGGWLDQLGANYASARTPIEPLRALLPSLRAEQVPVIWLNWGNRPDRANVPPGVLHVYDPDGASIGLGGELPGSGARVLERGSWSAQVVDELVIEAADLRVDKYRMSGFFDTELAGVLVNLDVTTVLFSGVNLDQCVLATLMDAAGLGYDCVLLEDCSATTSPATCAEATLYNVARCFGFVTSGSALLEGIEATEAGAAGRVADGTRSGVSYELDDLSRAVGHHITAGDPVKLAPIHHPSAAHDTSVFLEVWEPGGSQPPNSHPTSTETFLFLAGEGMAHCDDASIPVRAGQHLVLLPGSLHHIENAGEGRLYAITTMAPDNGFAELVTSGPAAPLDEADLAVLLAGPPPPHRDTVRPPQGPRRR